ncbi:MAG TPA: CPBP family intramembrane glutamic endopeptidase [Candidatus Thermoplasmatota archaeon]
MWLGAIEPVLGLLLQAGPPPLTLEELQAIYWIVAALLVARMAVAPVMYWDARRKSNRESWWGTAALLSPLIAGIIYLVMRAPKDGPGRSSWNPWVVCPHCGTPRGWSPDPCPRCGHVLPLAGAAPPPGYPAPPPTGYAPRPGYPVPPPGYAPPPGYTPPPAAPARVGPAKKSTVVTVPQVVGALLFAILLTNVVAQLALLPTLTTGITQAELEALQQVPLFILLSLLLQDSILLAVTLDQSLFQGRLTREKMGLAWSKTGKGLPWHVGVGVGAGLLTFAFTALFLDTLLRVLEPLGFGLAEDAAGPALGVGSFSDYLTLLPAVAVLAPVAEELFFRGYALGGLAQRGYVGPGVIITSALFAAIHLNPFTFIPLMAAGTVLAGVYLRTGSLVAPIVGHAANNFLALTLAYFGF